MKILLLGGTGRTGKHVLKAALEKGYEVHCPVRKSDGIDERAQIFEGTPSDSSILEKAIEGCDCVVGVLNISRNSDFPWSGLRTPEKFLSDVMSKLIPLAKKNDVKRMVLCSAWGVSETKKDIPGWFDWFIENSNIGVAYRDHARQEKLLEASELDWTIVRPVGLTNFGRSESVKESYNNSPKPGLLVSRKTVAHYMVDCIRNENLIHKKVVLSNG